MRAGSVSAPHWARRGAVLALLAGLTSCVSFAPDRAAQSAEAAAAAAHTSLIGRWTIQAHVLAPVSAMDEQAAQAWHGRWFEFGHQRALLAGRTCPRPHYLAQMVDLAAWLRDYRISLSDLPDTLPTTTATWQQLRCAPPEGGDHDLIQLDAQWALAPRDGVLFVLRRDSAFRAHGNEPFWALAIGPQGGVQFQVPGQPTPIRVATQRRDLPQGVQEYSYRSEALAVAIRVEPQTCIDQMSGWAYTATVTVHINQARWNGCGGGLV